MESEISYRVHNSLPLVLVVGHIIQVHALQTYFFKIHFIDIVLPSMFRSSKFSLSVRCQNWNPLCTCLFPIIATRSVQLILLDLITRIRFNEQYQSCSSSLCSLFSSPPITSSLLEPNMFLNTILPIALSLCSSLSVSDRVSHLSKTTGRIIILHILMFVFLGSREDKRFLTEC